MNGKIKTKAGIEIEEGTDASTALRQHLGSRAERMRSSYKRRKNLETHLFLNLEQKVRVILGDFSTAAVFLNTDVSDISDDHPISPVISQGDKPVVFIPTRRIEQRATDYNREEFDQIVQYAYADHERGHILYTPGDYIQSKLKQIPSGKRDTVHTIINSLEDGAIEEQLRSDNQSVGLRLSTLHANLAAEKMNVAENSGLTRTFVTAVIGYILDLGRYDAGFTRMLLDEDDARITFEKAEHKSQFQDFQPQIENVVADVLTASTPHGRADRMFSFAEELVNEANENVEDIATDGEIDQRGMGKQIDGSHDQNQISGTESPEPTEHNTSGENIRDRAREVLNDEGDESVAQDEDADKGSATNDGKTERETNKGANNEKGNSVSEGNEDGTGGENTRDDSGETSDKAGDSDDDLNIDRRKEPDETEGNTETEEVYDDSSTESEDDEMSVTGEPDRRAEQGDTGSGKSGKDSNSDRGRENRGGSDENAPPSVDDRTESDERATDGLEEGRHAEEKVVDRQEQAMEEAIKNHTQSMGSTLSGSEAEAKDTLTFVPPTENFDRERWMKAQNDSQNLMGQFGKMLEEHQPNEWKRGTSTGQIDDSFIVDLLLGSDNCMRQRQRSTQSPTDRISVIMMIDRSNSMTADDIACAERTGAGLALAFEREGIDVSVMDMFLNTARIANPFEFPVSQHRRMLITGESGGQTPLSDTLSMAADRVRWKRGETFVVVITDGEPNSPDAYRDTLNEIGQFAHVVGVEIALGQQRKRPQYEHNYHMGTSVSNADELVDDIDQMISKKAF